MCVSKVYNPHLSRWKCKYENVVKIFKLQIFMAEIFPEFFFFEADRQRSYFTPKFLIFACTASFKKFKTLRGRVHYTPHSGNA